MPCGQGVVTTFYALFLDERTAGTPANKDLCINSEQETQMHFHYHFDLTPSTHNSMAPVAIAMECLTIFMYFSLQHPCELRRYCLHLADGEMRHGRRCFNPPLLAPNWRGGFILTPWLMARREPDTSTPGPDIPVSPCLGEGGIADIRRFTS